MARLTPNGTIDVTFDGDSGSANGIVDVTMPHSGDSKNYGMTLLSDGGILLAGYVLTPGTNGALLKLDSLGRRDTSFSGDGRYIGSIGNGYYWDTVEQADGRIAVVGWEWNGNQDPVFARFNADGTLDSGFDGPGGTGNGEFVVTGAGNRTATAIDLLDDGDIVASAWSDANGGDVLVYRLNGSDGTLDQQWDGPSGSGNGIATFTLSAGNDAPFDVHVTNGDDVFVSGRTTDGGDEDAFVMKLEHDGTYDVTFDGPTGSGNGLAKYYPTAANDTVAFLAEGPDGDLLLSGIAGGTTLLWTARLEGNPIPDYASGSQDWDQGSGFFGACLDAFSGTGSAATWTASGCPQTDPGGQWRAIPISGAPTTLGQLAASQDDGEARVRFASRVPNSQTPGTYIAPVVFEVIAPAA